MPKDCVFIIALYNFGERTLSHCLWGIVSHQRTFIEYFSLHIIHSLSRKCHITSLNSSLRSRSWFIVTAYVVVQKSECCRAMKSEYPINLNAQKCSRLSFFARPLVSQERAG